MAKRGQMIDELYLTLGLDIARLQLDFDTAGQTVSQSMARLGSKVNKLQLKMETDLSKLEGVGSELDKIKVKQEAINKQLDAQRQKEQILAAVLKDAQKNSGIGSGATEKAEKDLLKQQRLIAQMEAELRKLGKAQTVNVKLQVADAQTAEQKIQDSIARMNAKIQNIRVKAEMDTSALKAGTAEIDKQKIAVNALNKELSVQYQKLAQMQNAWKLSAKNNLGSVQAINAGTDYMRQQQAVKALENEIQRLNAEIAKTGNAAPTHFGKITAAAQKAKSKVDSFISGVGKINSAIGTLTSTLSSGMGLFNLSANAVKAGHETKMLADRLHTTAGEAGQLKRAFGLIDADVTSIIPLFARLNKQITAAGDKGNNLTEAAERYGMTLTNSSGGVLSYTELLAQLAKGYRVAQEEGETAAYVADVLGARGAAIEPLLADYEALISASKDVKTTGLANPAEAEKAYRELKKMEFEISQLKGAMGNALLPITSEVMPEVVDGFRSMVKMVAENKDGLAEFGKLAGEVFGGTAKAIMSVVVALGDMKKALGEVSGSSEAENVLRANGYDEYLDRGNNLGTILGAMIGGRFGGVKGAAGGSIVGNQLVGALYAEIGKFESKYLFGNWDYMKQKAEIMEAEKRVVEDFEKSKQKLQQETNDKGIAAENKRKLLQAQLEDEIANTRNEKLREKLQAIKENVAQSISQGKSEAQAWKEAEKEIAKAVKEAKKEAAKANKELEDSIYKLTHNDHQNALFDADKAAEEMRKRGANEELVTRENELKKAKIQKDFQRDVLDSVNSIFKSELQNRLDTIEREKEAWKQKGLDEISATKWAEESKAKVMREWENTIAQNIDSIWKTELQNRLDAIEREKEAWKQKGLDEVKATEWAEKAKLDAKRNAAIQALRDQKEELEVFRRYGQEGLTDYYRGKYGFTREDLNFTPEELERFQQAQKGATENILPNFRDPKVIQAEMENMERSFKIVADGIEYTYKDLFGSINQSMTKLAQNPVTTHSPTYGQNPDKNITDNRQATVNVNIQNAVTQDNEGMRVLADNLADRIKPALESAWGGGENSYSNW